MRNGAPCRRASARLPLLAAPLLTALLALCSLPATTGAQVPAPTNLAAKDRPGDSGGATLLTWKDPPGLPPDAKIQIRRTVPPAYEWADVATVKPGVERYEDTSAKDGVVYRYEIRVVAPAPAPAGAPGGATHGSVSPVGPSASEPAPAPAGASSGAHPRAPPGLLLAGDREPPPPVGEGYPPFFLHALARPLGLRLAHHAAPGAKSPLTPRAARR